MAAKKTVKAEKNPKKPVKGSGQCGDGKRVEAKRAADERPEKKPVKPVKKGDKRAEQKEKKRGEPGKPASKLPAPKPPAKKGPQPKRPPAASKTPPTRSSKGGKVDAAAASTKKSAARGATPQGPAASSGRKRKGTRGRARRHSELTPKIIGRLREKLLEKHRDLVGAVTSSKGDSREQYTDGTEDYIDYAVSSYDREFLLSLTELEQRELRRVDEALRRIDQGDYGFCQASGEEIPLKRLEAQPWARYCLRVQELEDQGLLDQDDFDTPTDTDEESSDDGDLEDDDEPEEDEESEVEYRDEIPGDDGMSDPDAEERVV